MTNVFIFAVNTSHEIRMAPDGDRNNDQNAVKHETLFHNAPVLAAGEIFIANGVVSGINDVSGSYGTRGFLETDPRFARNLLQAFSQNGIPMTPAVQILLTRYAEAT